MQIGKFQQNALKQVKLTYLFLLVSNIPKTLIFNEIWTLQSMQFQNCSPLKKCNGFITYNGIEDFSKF
jgi:hypothetical protein